MDEFEGLRRELQRVRAENVRLSRLLELRGQDTAPAPEQLSAPVAAPGLVTMASPTGDKLALFADRVPRPRRRVRRALGEHSHRRRRVDARLLGEEEGYFGDPW
ncbi:hypothetical protein [Micromonospora sp. NPDC047740]|uniref:hypothetical protein n=1 Tax=Micromonospora sp. NPDC047740 TaxID=3364254 RepID=UPI00371A1709